MPSLPDTASPQVHTHSAFRLTEKHFKNRVSKDTLPSLRPYLDGLVDLSRTADQLEDEVWKAGWWSVEQEPSAWNKFRKGKQRDLGERPELDQSELRQITLNDGRQAWVVAPGCILIPGYLSVNDQLTLLQSSLAEYTLPPNPLSLSTHYDLPPNLFHLYSVSPETLVQPKHAEANPSTSTSADASASESCEIVQSTSPQSATKSRSAMTRQLIETEPAAVLGYEEIVARNKTWTGDMPSDRLSPKSVERLMHQIRWANLGWVYQWSTKSYDFSSEEPIPFPSELKKLCSNIVAGVPWEAVFRGSKEADWASWPEDYAPDTGIVNFYQINDTLMGHVDRSELDPARPLVSLSLGHAAILLLGTASRADPPRPIILRSGDVLIMSGSGRQAYHGVPRIMEGTLPPHFAVRDDDDALLQAAKKWISTARININARQVFPPGFQRPDAT